MTEFWDERFRQGHFSRYPDLDLVRWLRTTKPSIRKVLELGSGAGANCDMLVNEGALHVTGIDASKEATLYAASGGNFVALHDNAPDYLLDLKSDYYDLVVDICSMYLLDVNLYRETVGEIFRILKPGGKFFTKSFGPKTTIDVFNKDRLSAGEVTTTLKIAGFQIDSYDTTERTTNDRKDKISEFVVVAHKP